MKITDFVKKKVIQHVTNKKKPKYTRTLRKNSWSSSWPTQKESNNITHISIEHIKRIWKPQSFEEPARRPLLDPPHHQTITSNSVKPHQGLAGAKGVDARHLWGFGFRHMHLKCLLQNCTITTFNKSLIKWHNGLVFHPH